MAEKVKDAEGVLFRCLEIGDFIKELPKAIDALSEMDNGGEEIQVRGAWTDCRFGAQGVR